MNITVYQCISVNNLKIGTISNSSVLQIGTSGRINALSHSNQTGEVPESPLAPSQAVSESPLVRLPPPTELYTS